MNLEKNAKQYIPYALVGAGIAWAIANHQKKAREIAEEAEESAQNIGQRFVNGTKEAAAKAKDKVEHWTEAAGEKSERVVNNVRSFADEKPLLVGSGIIAASALLGWLAPQTRDEVSGKVRKGVRQAIDSALHKGREIVNVAADEAKKAAEEARHNLASRMSK